MSADDINDSFFSSFTEAAQGDGEDIPGPPTLGQVDGFDSPNPHSENPAQDVASVVRRPSVPQEAGSRRRSRWGSTPVAEEEGEIEGDFDKDPDHDPAGASVQNQAAAAALHRAQADAQQQAFEQQIWASNGNGATMMAHVQGAATAAIDSFAIIMALVATLPVCVFAKQWVNWQHSPTEPLPSFVDSMKANDQLADYSWQ